MKKSILLGLGACALALGGVAALVGQKGAAETKADGTRDIYFKFTGTSYANNGASVDNLYAHYWGGDSGSTAWPGVKWDEKELVNDITYLKWTIPDDMTTVIFHVNGWTNNQDQTVDLGIPSLVSGENCFVQTTNNGSSKQDGKWYEFNKGVDDGSYLRGKIQGTTHWDSNQVTLTGSGNGPYVGSAELYSGDSVKAVLFKDGLLTEWMTFNTGASGEEIAKGTSEFPVNVSGENAVVTNRALYNISINFNNQYEGTNYWDYSFVDSATAWSNGFLNSMTCDPSGLAEPTFKEDGESWNTYATSYDALGEIAKDALYGATGSDGGSPIQQAAKRHDVIVVHHGYTAFMTNGEKSATRSPATAAQISSLNMANNTENGFVTIAIVVSAAALLGIGTLFIARKRRAE